MGTVTANDRLAQLSQQLRQELSATSDVSSDLFLRAGKLVVEELLKAEVADALGRDPHERREDGQAGYRNGFKSRQLRTAEGKLAVEVPQVRDFVQDGQEQTYRSAIWQALGRRSPHLDRLIVEMYARGLSTRDIEDLLKELSPDGQQPLLSKSSVSEVTEVLWEEFEA